MQGVAKESHQIFACRIAYGQCVFKSFAKMHLNKKSISFSQKAKLQKETDFMGVMKIRSNFIFGYEIWNVILTLQPM